MGTKSRVLEVLKDNILLRENRMNYERGMDLASWVEVHADSDVIVRLAFVIAEDSGEDEPVDEVVDFDRLHEKTGRLIGIVGGRVYLDHPTSTASMPVSRVVAMVERHIAETGQPNYGILGSDGFTAAPTPFNPAYIAQIEIDHEGLGRERHAVAHREHEEELSALKKLVTSQPCCLCGHMVQPDDGGWNVVPPDAGLGEEGDPWFVPIDATWRVVCIRHLDQEA